MNSRVGPVLDEDSWQPGAVVNIGSNSKLVITTNISAVSVSLSDLSYADGLRFAGNGNLASRDALYRFLFTIDHGVPLCP